jgi:hypothetical protein
MSYNILGSAGSRGKQPLDPGRDLEQAPVVPVAADQHQSSPAGRFPGMGIEIEQLSKKFQVSVLRSSSMFLKLKVRVSCISAIVGATIAVVGIIQASKDESCASISRTIRVRASIMST